MKIRVLFDVNCMALAAWLTASAGTCAAAAKTVQEAARVAPHAASAAPEATRNTPVPSALRQFDRTSLQKVVASAAKEMRIPGAVVLLITPKERFDLSYGTTQIGANKVPDAHTHFRIASNTKTMTAALIVLLAQENKLKFDDVVSKYISGVPNGDKITIANLLQMRSGLYNVTDDPKVAKSLDHDRSKVWTEQELLDIVSKHSVTAPGGDYHYNNTNYLLLGMVAEKLGGKPLSQLMQNRLFAPLKMDSTLYPVPSSSAIPEPYSHGYLYGSSSVALCGEPRYSKGFKAEAKSGKISPTDYTSINHSFAGGAGASISTAADLATWIKALTIGSVFNPQYHRRWLDSLLLEDPSNKAGMEYGYGISKFKWGTNNVMYFHGGETAGYNSFMGYDPTNKVTLVVWTNLTVSLDEMPTANSLMLAILDHIYSTSPLPPKGKS